MIYYWTPQWRMYIVIVQDIEWVIHKIPITLTDLQTQWRNFSLFSVTRAEKIMVRHTHTEKNRAVISTSWLTDFCKSLSPSVSHSTSVSHTCLKVLVHACIAMGVWLKKLWPCHWCWDFSLPPSIPYNPPSSAPPCTKLSSPLFSLSLTALSNWLGSCVLL